MLAFSFPVLVAQLQLLKDNRHINVSFVHSELSCTLLFQVQTPPCCCCTHMMTGAQKTLVFFVHYEKTKRWIAKSRRENWSCHKDSAATTWPSPAKGQVFCCSLQKVYCFSSSNPCLKNIITADSPPPAFSRYSRRPTMPSELQDSPRKNW